MSYHDVGFSVALHNCHDCNLLIGDYCTSDQGWRLGGRSPLNLRWGRPILCPPIFREVVLSDACESINRVKKGVFLVRKGSNTTFNIAKIGKIWEKKGKIIQI